jgi:hypothetical protein
VDNIKTDLIEIYCGCVDWIGLAKDRDKCRALVNAVMNILDPKNAGKLQSDYRTVGISVPQDSHSVSLN